MSALSTALGVVLTAGALAFAPAVAAFEWQVEEDASEIVFEYLADGKPTLGIFARFSGSGDFDPDRPDEAQLTLRIATRSIDLDDTLASAFATSAEWFDSKNHPEVVYELVDLTKTGEQTYEAIGNLTIRGETQAITSTIELNLNDELAEAKGTLNIQRADYLLGVGPSAAFVEIGPEVLVRFALVARPEN